MHIFCHTPDRIQNPNKFLMTRIFFLMFFYAFTACGQTIPQFTATIHDSSSQGYYFLVPIKMGPQGANFNPTHLILDKLGKVVYVKEFVSGLNTGDFKILKNGFMTYTYRNKYFMMDSSFTIVDSVYCKNGIQTDGHDMQVLTNGDFLLMGSENVVTDLSSYYLFNHNGSPGSQTASVKSVVIQIQDVNKNVIFEWHAKDYFSFADVDTNRLNNPAVVDWTHANAVEEDFDGNLLLSSRHFNEITKINRTTGAIMWRLGGNANQFTFTNDPAMFIGQHDCRRISNGHLTLLDNGSSGHPCSAKEYELDEINLTATLKWYYLPDSAIYSQSTGNVQRLSNGNTLIDFGNLNTNIDQPAFEVVDSSGQKVFEVNFADTLLTYRGFNFDSLPFQFPRPEISCSETGGIGYLDAGANYSSYKWSNGETSRIIALSNIGEYSVFVPAGDSGFISSIPFVVTDIGDPCNTLGNAVSENHAERVELFPNPSSGKIQLFNFDLYDTYELINSLGQKISSGKSESGLDLSDVGSGIYFMLFRKKDIMQKITFIID